MSKKDTSKQNIDAFIRQQEKENDERIRAKLAEEGKSPFLRLEIGENKFTLLPRIPTTRQSNFARDQSVFKVTKNDMEYDWPVTKSSPMHIKVVRLLSSAPVGLCVIRTGTGKNTRLDLKE